MTRRTNPNSRGFTLLELMIGMAVFLVISGAVLVGMSTLQANYRRAEMYTTMEQRLRATMELMAQEIGQAGLQASTIEGANTEGDAGTKAPYSLVANIVAGNPETANLSTASNMSVFAAYVGQWMQVTGANAEPIQVANVSGTNIQANFGHPHSSGTALYPMGVFPHGILAGSTGDPSVSPSTGIGSKLAMYGEIMGNGNGLWAVEYQCPSSYPGSLVRKQWNLASVSTTGTSYNLIDNVTACYFCWPSGTPGSGGETYAGCPQNGSTPQPVTLLNCSTGSCTYSIITQVGFTVTVSENVTLSNTTSTTQTITVSKSYSNIQPRNLITANNILTAACNSAINNGSAAVSGSTCPISTAYAGYLNGELQPDPAAITSMITNGTF